jgi:hypothetical protein
LVAMAYSFRMRIQIPRTMRIHSDESVWVLASEREDVVLRPRWSKDVLSSTDWFDVWGSGYTSNEQAQLAAEKWSSILQATFARLGFGADFGGEPPVGRVPDDAMEEPRTSGRYLDLVHGVVTFEGDLERSLYTADKPYVQERISLELIRRAVDAVITTGRTLASDEQLAFNLFSLSFFETIRTAS